MIVKFKVWKEGDAFWWVLTDKNGKPRARCPTPHARRIDCNNEVQFVRQLEPDTKIEFVTVDEAI